MPLQLTADGLTGLPGARVLSLAVAEHKPEPEFAIILPLLMEERNVLVAVLKVSHATLRLVLLPPLLI